MRPGADWSTVPIRSIEGLADAVYGAGLRTVQLSRGRVTGNLAFASRDGVIFGSGLIRGRVELTGCLSESMVTFGLGVILSPGSRQWLGEVESGNIGLFMPGDGHDALYYPGSLYATVTLPEERAEEIGARFGLALEVRRMGGSAVLRERLPAQELHRLRLGLERLHSTGCDPAGMTDQLLSVIVSVLGRVPRPVPHHPVYLGRASIVKRSREYIDANLHRNIPIEELAIAAGTSVRTLSRAFTMAMQETPLHYIQRLRMHRIREALLARSDPRDTVTSIANRWGISELGRFAGRYREVFDEMPSQTGSRASI